jgi:hypothetical protein
MMLEELNDIKWSELKHAYGSAWEVPYWIQSLLSHDRELLKKTFSKLNNNLYHQGTVYEASVTAIPFLIELLTIDDVERKSSILRFLSHLSHGTYLKSYSFWEWDDLAREEVAKGFNIYVDLLNHEDPKVRLQAVVILSYSPRFQTHKANMILDKLLQSYATERNELVLSAIINGLGNGIAGYRSFVNDRAEDVALFIEKIYRKETNQKLQLVALLAIPKIQEGKTPQYVIDELVKTVLDPPSRVTPASIGSPDKVALRSLWHLDTVRRIEALQTAMLKSSDSLKVLIIASALMQWSFVNENPNWPLWTYDIDAKGNAKQLYEPKQTKVEKQDISHTQAQVLTAIVNTDKAWEIQHNLLEHYGFPADRDEARRLLAES